MDLTSQADKKQRDRAPLQRVNRPDSEPTVHVAARVPVDLAASFKRVAVNEDRTVSQALRQAIRCYISENENGRPDTATALQRAEQEPAGAPG